MITGINKSENVTFKYYNLPHWVKTLSTTQVVGGNGWKNPCVIESLLWNTWPRWTLTSHWPQRNGCGRQSQQRITAGPFPQCWQIRVAACCPATMVLTRRGLSFSHHPDMRLFRVDQSVEAWGGVSSSRMSSPSERLSSWRKDSVKTMNNIEQKTMALNNGHFIIN